jgi:hypothetical protein
MELPVHWDLAVRIQELRSTALSTTGSGWLKSCHCPLSDQFTLELSDCSQDMEVVSICSVSEARPRLTSGLQIPSATPTGRKYSPQPGQGRRSRRA